ncbi:MAG: DUF3566 domain-containing protein [bacterium]|nr:DUF3566 domain-containing protein [bacterium]MDE0669044.1 DUF3566 domain-containing protein [bacterium]
MSGEPSGLRPPRPPAGADGWQTALTDDLDPTPEAPPVDPPSVERWTLAERRRRRRLQIRSVRRIVRRVELWSVLKLSLILYLCLWAVLLVAALILWSAVDSTGLIDRIEAFVTQIFGLESFEFVPGQIFRVYAVASLVLALLATLFNVMAAVLFNLISELVGGLRIMLVEEESTRFRPARARPRPMRARPSGRGPAAPRPSAMTAAGGHRERAR